MARCVMHGKKNRFLLSAMMDKNHHGKGEKNLFLYQKNMSHFCLKEDFYEKKRTEFFFVVAKTNDSF